jgi:hypothetical protein
MMSKNEGREVEAMQYVILIIDEFIGIIEDPANDIQLELPYAGGVSSCYCDLGRHLLTFEQGKWE